MSFRDLFTSSRYAPAWVRKTEAAIWMLLPTGEGAFIAELRDPVKKRVSYCCIDERDGSVRWHASPVEEPWWIGIESVHQGVLFLHGYIHPTRPEHRSIYAVDSATGTLLWRNDTLGIWFVYGGRVYAYDPSSEESPVTILDARTGAILPGPDPSRGEELRTLQNKAYEEQQPKDLLLPEPLDRESIAEPAASLAGKELKGKKIEGEPEAIEHRGMYMMNYFHHLRDSLPDRPALENRFCIFDTAKSRKVFEDVVSARVHATVPDSFFVKGECVYYIKDMYNLIAIRLWK